jgi:UDP-N-acetylmuramyl-tripeptide synthetase
MAGRRFAVGAGDKLEAIVHTTPEPVTLHRLLYDMQVQECNGVIMEVSSHAVRQQRTMGIDYDIGMLTNITRDHLDYHPTLDDYIEAKREFCYSLIAPGRSKKNGVLVYSRDNERSRVIGEEFPGDTVSTSMHETADVYADRVDATLQGTRFRLQLREGAQADVDMRLLGIFTVSNAVLAAGAAHALGIGIEGIKEGLEAVDQVPGRFQALGGKDRPVVIVDYSHTPDSLERTLQFCRRLKPRRLIAVFGCGGDRDRGKRPLMGTIAQENADIAYVTSDNPRSEEPNAIIEEILGGMDRAAAGLFVESDRGKAIRAAIADAGVGDLVAVCGKGHEDYQIVGAKRHHFDDREEAAHALSTWSAN